MKPSVAAKIPSDVKMHFQQRAFIAAPEPLGQFAAQVARSFEAGGSDEDGVYLDARDFGQAPRISFDKAVLERHEAVAVTPLDAP
ncbi:MAG: hypothetical protein ABI606_19950, partial [Rhodoferax sp.]